MEIVKAQLVRNFQNTILHWHEANKIGEKSTKSNRILIVTQTRRFHLAHCLPLVDFHSEHFSKRCYHHRLALRVFAFEHIIHIFVYQYSIQCQTIVGKWKCFKMNEKKNMNKWQILMGCVCLDAWCIWENLNCVPHSLHIPNVNQKYENGMTSGCRFVSIHSV